jgi:uncharacterized protein
MMIDTHTHMDTRPYEDFELMALAGITDVLTLAHDPMRMSSAIVFRDHFERLFSEKDRAGKNGIKLHVCLGLHPRTEPDDVDECLRLLESYLAGGAVTAIGEAGIENITPGQEYKFRKQIDLAIKYEKPVIVHTPRKEKSEVTGFILDVLSSYPLGRGRVVVDHADRDTTKKIFAGGYIAGLTVQPGKLSPSEAAEIVMAYGGENIVLNTDASANLTDPLGVPRTVHLLKLRNAGENAIAMASELNARRIFSI